MTGVIVILAGLATAAEPPEGAENGPCALRTTREDVEEGLAKASAAYEAADLRAFEIAVEDTRRALPCLGRPLTSSVVAQLHRIEGLAAFVASDTDHVLSAFGGARRLEPDFVFPDSWAPAGNPVRDLYDRGQPDSPVVEAPLPPSGTLRFDGRPTRERFTEHPTLYQWVELSGNVVRSAYLWPSDPLPPYPTVAPIAQKRSARVPLLVAGGVGLASGAALLGGAAAARSAYDSDTTTIDNVDGRMRLTNGLVIGSGVTFAIGVGTGAAGLLVGR
ncbi:MAG: hypothetical protein R3F61_29930 [Myxococcota bacterium]